jgi:hypothetical protein
MGFAIMPTGDVPVTAKACDADFQKVFGREVTSTTGGHRGLRVDGRQRRLELDRFMAGDKAAVGSPSAADMERQAQCNTAPRRRPPNSRTKTNIGGCQGPRFAAIARKAAAIADPAELASILTRSWPVR